MTLSEQMSVGFLGLLALIIVAKVMRNAVREWKWDQKEALNKAIDERLEWHFPKRKRRL